MILSEAILLMGPEVRRLEQAHRPALAHHVHRVARLGSRVLISGAYGLARPSQPGRMITGSSRSESMKAPTIVGRFSRGKRRQTMWVIGSHTGGLLRVWSSIGTKPSHTRPSLSGFGTVTRAL